MFVRALRGKEEVCPPKHTSTLDIVNEVGLLYADQGKMREAEEMYVRAALRMHRKLTRERFFVGDREAARNCTAEGKHMTRGEQISQCCRISEE